MSNPVPVSEEKRIYIDSINVKMKLNAEEIATLDKRYNELYAQLSALTPAQRNAVKSQVIYLNSLKIQKKAVENQQVRLGNLKNGITNNTLTINQIRTQVGKFFGSKNAADMVKYSSKASKLNAKINKWHNKVAILSVKQNASRNRVYKWLVGKGIKISEHFEKENKFKADVEKKKNEFVITSNNVKIRKARREASNLRASIQYYNSRGTTMRNANSKVQKMQARLNELNRKGVKMTGRRSLLIKQAIKNTFSILWTRDYASDGIRATKDKGIL